MTLGVCNNPQKNHGPQLSVLAFVHGLRMSSLCVAYVFCSTQVLNNDTMKEFKVFGSFIMGILDWLL